MCESVHIKLMFTVICATIRINDRSVQIGRQIFGMEGSLFEINVESASPKTLVLLGRKGNGKTATANSILGMQISRSKHDISVLKSTTELQPVGLEADQIYTVIDTPGLFDPAVGIDVTAKQIISCINKVEIGIHAFLVVFSVRSRFSKEEEAAISCLQTFFGRKIFDYMIVVFTGGDELDADEQTLEDFLLGCPKALKETLSLCENRVVLFDNKTKDQTKRADQLENLSSLVKMVSGKNGGMPYNDVAFTDFEEFAERIQALKKTRHDDVEHDTSMLNYQMNEEQFKHVFEKLVEPHMKETTMNLERQLVEERDARVKAEENAKAAKEQYDEMERYLQMEDYDIRRRKEQTRLFSMCVIL
ncbi:immune-associated nucleotide-binding protein 1-like [Rutidosis leptorrhynchoides]|uniref:immune-associated nucleotide-binding protein 1-like n=1 Tax=Rutidosis leptorrhynchoides TaxID=125765 RepID=UPI003A99F6C8